MIYLSCLEEFDWPKVEEFEVAIRVPSCGTLWNTFWTGGVCPGCGYHWHKTQCLVCGVISSHADWYHYPDRDPAAEVTDKELTTVEPTK